MPLHRAVLPAFSCASLCPAVLSRCLPAAGLKQKRTGENAGGIDSAARVCYNRMRKTITKSGWRRSSPPPAAVFRVPAFCACRLYLFLSALRTCRALRACRSRLSCVPVCRMRCVCLPFAPALYTRPARLPFAAPSAPRRFPPVQKQWGLQSSSSSINS